MFEKGFTAIAHTVLTISQATPSWITPTRMRMDESWNIWYCMYLMIQ